jgi:site-specific DNA recombinase
MQDTFSQTAAAAYVRVSTEEQAREGYSLNAQRVLIEERVQAEGWTLVEVYADEGWSGRRADRPDYQRLLDDAAAGVFEVLVVWRLDRFGRNTIERLTAEAGLLRAGVRIVSLTEPEIQEEDATAPLLKAIRAGMAEMESKLIGQRTRAGLQAVARSGRQPCGQPPLGYRAVGERRERRWIVDKAEAEVVRRIFASYIAGTGTNSICRELNADGITTRRGARFSPRVVHELVSNPAYVGKVRLKGEVFEGAHEAILDEETWARAQGLRVARRESAGKGRGRTPVGSHLFRSGLLRCGICGGAMSPRTNTSNGWEHYRCVRRNTDRDSCSMPGISRRLVDERALDTFLYAIDVEGTRAAITAEADRQVAEANALLDLAERELTQVEESRERVESDYLRGGLSSENYQRLGSRLDGEREAAEAEVVRHRTRVQEISEQVSLINADSEFAKAMHELRLAIQGEIESAEGIDAMRAALTRAFSRVTLHREGRSVEVGLDGVVLRETDPLILVPEVRAIPQALYLDQKQSEPNVPSPPGRRGRQGRRWQKRGHRPGDRPRPRPAGGRARRGRA